MHYRNGREAKNGDRVIQLGASNGKVVAAGTLVDAVPGNDYCNGQIVNVPYAGGVTTSMGACLCDCLHVDDIEALLAEKDLNKRPDGK